MARQFREIPPVDSELECLLPRAYVGEVFGNTPQYKGPITVRGVANDAQVGGDHYKSKAIQPWDYIVSNDLGFLAGNVVKYITRYGTKGGVIDLKKAQHYLDKLIEVEEGKK